MTRRAATAITLAVLGLWALVRWVVYDYPQLGDTRVYQHAVRMMDAGFVPYRDFDIEYPPLATGLFWLLGQIPGPPTLVFSLAMALCLAATALAAWIAGGQLGLSAGRRVTGTLIVALTPLLLGTLVQTRYDLVLAALLGWIVVAALGRRFAWMWGLTAAAVAIKLVPVLIVPVLAVWHLRQRGRRPATAGLAAFAAGVAATFVPFLVMAPQGTWELFRYHLARPLQIESLGSSIILALGLPYRQVQSYGSDNIDGTLPQLAASASTLALVVVVALVAIAFVRATRRDLAPDHLVAALAATMVGGIVFGKVLSPQYLVWLLPAILLLRGRRGTAATAIVAVTMGVTQLVFPLLYTRLVLRADPIPVTLLAVRNLLLVGLLAITLIALNRRSAPGRTAPDAGASSVLSSSTPPVRFG